MARRKSLLHNLEVVAQGESRSGSYPISPRLLDKKRLEDWRQNIIHSGTEIDIKRYAKAIMSESAIKKLPLRPEGC